MADTDTEEQKRIAYLQSLQADPPPPEQIGKDAYPIEQVAAFQRGIADQAVAASRNQPNAIPATTNPDFGNTRAVDYAQRGLPMGNTLVGDVDPNAPKTGFYTNQAGENLGFTTSGQFHKPAPFDQGATGIQGQLSPQEQAFWAAHPNGAVKDPQTGNLIGLGSSDAYRQNTLQNAFPAPASQPQKPPDFVHIPEVNPALIAQRQQIQNEIATTQNQLRTASTIGSKKQPSQYQILNQKLNTLTQANNSLGLEHYRQTEEQRKATDNNSELQNKWFNDQASMAITGGLNQIKSTPGSDQYHADVFALRQQIGRQFPGATLDNQNRALFEKATTAHNHEAEFLARAKAENKNVELTGYHEGQATYKTTPTLGVQLSDEIQKRNTKALADLGLNAQQFAQINKVEAGNLPKDAKGNVTDRNKFTGATGGEFTRVTTGGQQHIMRTDTYNRLATAITSTTPQQEVKTDTSAPTAANQRATKPPQVRQNGVIYNLQPDGSYK